MDSGYNFDYGIENVENEDLRNLYFTVSRHEELAMSAMLDMYYHLYDNAYLIVQECGPNVPARKLQEYSDLLQFTLATRWRRGFDKGKYHGTSDGISALYDIVSDICEQVKSLNYAVW